MRKKTVSLPYAPLFSPLPITLFPLFDWRSQVPNIIPRVFHPGGTTVGLSRRRLQRSCTGTERTRVSFLKIFDVNKQRGGHRLRVAMRLTHLDHRVAYAHQGVMDHSLGRLFARNLLSRKGLLHEFD